MFPKSRSWLVLVSLALLTMKARSQETPPPAPTPIVPKEVEPPPPAADAVAVTVNGQAIPELAVYRGLLRVPPKHREAARKEIVNFLIDNLVVDQYLTQLKVQVEPKELDDRIEQIKAEAAKDKVVFADLLKKLFITETDLRRELAAALRWDKFVLEQGSEKVLRETFEKNPNMFDGTTVHARHILLPLVDGKADDAKVKLAALRKGIEEEVGKQLAKLPAGTDNLTREKERMNAVEKAFALAAAKDSTCPSKRDGGDVGRFPRAGKMVEPFAKAAFALKPFEMSEPVTTEFGVHLILSIDYQPGKQVKFEDVKGYVQEIYAERLREAVLTTYKARSKIEVMKK